MDKRTKSFTGWARGTSTSIYQTTVSLKEISHWWSAISCFVLEEGSHERTAPSLRSCSNRGKRKSISRQKLPGTPTAQVANWGWPPIDFMFYLILRQYFCNNAFLTIAVNNAWHASSRLLRNNKEWSLDCSCSNDAHRIIFSPSTSDFELMPRGTHPETLLVDIDRPCCHRHRLFWTRHPPSLYANLAPSLCTAQSNGTYRNFRRKCRLLSFACLFTSRTPAFTRCI